MYKHLYNQFSHWYHGGGIWLYSDPHFGDEEMRHIRGCISDEEQVQRINRRVTKNDTLIILGDVGDTEYVKQLHGYKILIMGNHDAGASNYQRIRTDEVREGSYEYVPDYEKIGTNEFRGAHIWKEVITQPAFDNHLFDEVYEGPLFISDRILLSHEPIDFPYALNIHGHDHGRRYVEGDVTHCNVCAEWIAYTPVNLKWIIESGRMKLIPSLHRATIDAVIARKS